MEEKELENINKKMEDFMEEERLQKYDFKRPFNELPNIPFLNYKETKEAMINKKVSVIVNFMNSSSVIFDLVAKRSEKLILRISLFATYIIAFLMIGLAFYLRNYILIISVLWLIIAPIFSSYYFNPPLYPFKGRRVADLALVIGVFSLVFSNSYTIPLLAFSYALMHWIYVSNRKIYGTILKNRAMQSEILFRFLYIGEYIQLS